jgi:hypothetical protein
MEWIGMEAERTKRRYSTYRFTDGETIASLRENQLSWGGTGVGEGIPSTPRIPKRTSVTKSSRTSDPYRDEEPIASHSME